MGKFETGKTVETPKYLSMFGEAVKKPQMKYVLGVSYESPIMSVNKLLSREPLWAGYETGTSKHLGGVAITSPVPRKITVQTHGAAGLLERAKQKTVYPLANEVLAFRIERGLDPSRKAGYKGAYETSKNIREIPDELVVNHDPTLAINTAFIDAQGNLLTDPAAMKQAHVKHKLALYGSTLDEVMMGEALPKLKTGRLPRDTEMTGLVRRRAAPPGAVS